MRLGIILAILVLLTITYASHAEAAPYNNFVSIIQSRACAITDCVDPHVMAKYDNSTRRISGDLVWKSSINDFVRVGGYVNSQNWYNANMPGETIIFYEPDQQTLVRSKQIIITNGLAEFSPIDSSSKKEIDSLTDIRTTYQGVYVDPKCTAATVNMKFYPDLNVIINHLVSGCKTDLGNKVDHITAKTKLNYCGNWCQYEKFMKDAKSKSKTYLIESQIKKTGYTPQHFTVELSE